ncbi:MAG: sigma-70 family RNA polymerase sigma factor [Rhizobiaceae bacterium]|nr:sigma-70 family RNA polymerase sigma factor [Rhizobiaceae bacterium]
MNSRDREEEWAQWMRAAIAGDAAAYRRFLEAVTPRLRALARRGCQRSGAPEAEAEDIVQEALLAIHLKRSTWDSARPIGPWISTIVRNKLIDTLRRRGHRISVPIDDVIETLEAAPQSDPLERQDVERLLAGLNPNQQAVVRAISIDGRSVRDTAARLGMAEGTIRVTLHRALKALAAIYRRGDEG